MDNYLIRHFLAALSYRTTVAMKDAPSNYPTLAPGHGLRSPMEILNHMSTLLAYTARCYTGEDGENGKDVGDWTSEVDRFYAQVEALDQVLEEGVAPVTRTVEQLLQGPLADAMTHVGQLAMLRRVAGSPVPYENYMNADIRVGHPAAEGPAAEEQ
jgi:hypothetical protein